MDKHTYILTKGSNLILLYKAREIIDEFKKKNIDFLLLKGLAFAYTIYPDAGLRPMSDIDFLIKREDLNSIEEILRQRGYREISPKAQRRYGCNITFCQKDNVIIEMHWDLCQYGRFKGIIDITRDFWKRAGEFKLDGISVQTLSAEDHILHIALHYSLVHLFKDEKGISDLFFLIAGHKVEWKKIIDNASKYGLRIPLYYSLLKTQEVKGLKLPDFVLRSLKPSFLKQALLAGMFKYHTTPLRYLCQALMVDDFADTLKVSWRLWKGMRRQVNTFLNSHPDAPFSGNF